jgi:hypothetical protein
MISGCREDASSAPESEFEIDNSYTGGPVVAAVRISESKITVASTLTMEIEASIEEGYELTMPDPEKVFGDDFDVREASFVGERLDADGNVAQLMRFRVAPMTVGNVEVPKLTFEFKKVEGDGLQLGEAFQINTEPITIEVLSLLAGDEQPEVVDEAGTVVSLTRHIAWWWYAIGAAILIAIGGIVTAVILKRGKHKEIERIYRCAHEIAYQRLQKLQAAGLIEAGKLKEYYERTSGILRYYIEDRFELKAPERTTEEFLYEIQYGRGVYVLAEDDRSSLEQFLKHCDLVKFARHEPTRDQIERTVELVEGFVERTKSSESLIDVTDNSEISMREEA